MAAPPQITCANLSGKFALNKSLSDDVDAMLECQGIAWAIRKIVGLASVVLTIKSYTKDSNQHIDVSTLVAGLDKTQEDRTLDWVDADHADKIFGKVRHRNRFATVSDFKTEGLKSGASEEDTAFLKGEKLKDGKTESKWEDGIQLVQSWNESTTSGWKAEQVWGFEVVGGERHYVRRVVVWNGAKSVRTRIVYDYRGEGKK